MDLPPHLIWREIRVLWTSGHSIKATVNYIHTHPSCVLTESCYSDIGCQTTDVLVLQTNFEGSSDKSATLASTTKISL